MKWHEEVLDRSGRQATQRLAHLGRAFYLAGGTGLALRLGHRISLDLDLFSQGNALGRAERMALLELLKSSGPVEVRQEKDGTCHLELGKTAVSLFYYPYPLLGPTSSWNGLAVAGLEDIAAMKLSAVVGRGARKDFVDLYALVQRLGLERVLKAGRRRFPDHPDFDLQAARALVYFEDAEKEPMPRLIQPVAWPWIKSFFESQVRAFLRRRLD